jgi:two-component system OmpR family response regulator/two-component system response regulator QseB
MAGEQMRILLVEDDHPLAETMRTMLGKEPFTVDWVDDGKQALSAMGREHFDLLILDLGLPGMGGMEVLRTLRQGGDNTPVIILTARAEMDNKLRGLDAGADDYLTKPFSMAELKARVRAVTRRGSDSRQPDLCVGALSLSTLNGQLTLAGESILLPRSEYQILHYLMRHPDQVATRHRLEEQLYGWAEGVESNALEVHIHHLRRRIGKQTIRTIRGVGYLLDSRQAEQAGSQP